MRNLTSDAQLVIGSYEERELGEAEVLRRVDRYLCEVETRRLMIWNSQGERWYQTLTELCRRHQVEAHLWYPVLSDRAGSVHQILVTSALGHRGYGSLGRWEGLGCADETFLFSCPEHGDDRMQAAGEIITLLGRYDFSGVFLDRIRYPSPANGLEMLFCCYCERCSALAGQHEQDRGREAVDLMVDLCRSGWTGGWDEFVHLSGLTTLIERRYRAIADVVNTIALAIDRSRYTVGLDLFSPALAPLVGQSYRELSRLCDWIKAMTYTHAIGPAGLPLELRSLVRALVSSDSAIAMAQALRWTEALLGVELESPDLLTEQIERAIEAVDGSCELLCGIELVDHPLFPTRIGADQAEELVEQVANSAINPIACWNLLYIPRQNYRFLAQRL